MKQKSLAIIRSSYRPDGGAERILARMIDGLKSLYEIDISLITKAWQDEKKAPYSLVSIAKHGWSRRSKFLRFNRQVQLVLQKNSYDLVQSHERIPGCQIFRAGDGVHREWLEIRKKNANFAERLFWEYSPYHRAVLAEEAAMFSHPALEKVICNSTQIRTDILKHYPQVHESKLEVIYNGINLDEFEVADQKTKLGYRQELHLAENDRVLLYVGSGFARKGLLTLLQSLSKVADWKLLVVGKDKQQKKYLKLCDSLGITDRVTFTGVKSNVKSYYAAADLFVHPALYDPAPNVVLEAMASGLGVIVSHNTGNKGLIETDKSGYIFTAGDDNALANLLEKCSDSKKLLLMGKEARKKAEQFPISRMVNELVQLYQSLL